MQSNTVPAELQLLREEIDKLDDELVAVLARRFQVTDKVGQLKAEYQLSSVDPVREEAKLVHLKELSEKASLNSEFVLDLFRNIFAEVVRNHRSFL